ncbi:MAG: DNA methyltransferase [Pseudomonadota bacterium]
MSPIDPQILRHLAWLTPLERFGLVVSPHALLKAQAYVQGDVLPLHRAFVDLLRREEGEDGRERVFLNDFPRFTREILGWRPLDLAGAEGGPTLPEELEAPTPGYAPIRPSYAVPDPDGGWLLLVQVLPAGSGFDARGPAVDGAWDVEPQIRMERLLRETGVPIGLLCDGAALRLVYAPSGENSGHLTFPLIYLASVGGRLAFSALHMLLSAERLFLLPDDQRLPWILKESRRYQNDVTVRLAEQVQGAMHDLLAGFEAADQATHGRLLGQALHEDRDHVYGGLLTTLMRLVFVLYAEENRLLPQDPVFVQHYSVLGLFAQLSEDEPLNTDTMDQRYGGWARLLTLFRLLYDGGGHGPTWVPARAGRLFDPDAYPFLEGRPLYSHRQGSARLDPPRVSDGVLLRVLRALLVLDSERLSYRSLNVEKIGSVYEAMMGFTLQVAHGPSVALGKDRVVVDLAELLAQPPAKRAAWLAAQGGGKLSGAAAQALKSAGNPEEVVAALGRRLSDKQRGQMPAGSLYLQPSDERRRSGTHYTPEDLARGVVEHTLDPVLARLGDAPQPDHILALKVCDPAMGSGAFLVAACRHLADKLLVAWQRHGLPPIPPDEDPLLHARRTVAQSCLYGVDKNPFAVDLAKLSLWLFTLAREHPFSFVDHALRCGDSLVGHDRWQVATFDPVGQRPQDPQIRLFAQRVTQAVDLAMERRRSITALGDLADEARKWELLAEAEQAMDDVRLVGDCLVAAFFGASKDQGRRDLRLAHRARLEAWIALSDAERREAIRDDLVLPLRAGDGDQPRLVPFHWQVEFPEVFERPHPGFDAIVGNPPFAGKNTLGAGHRAGYLDWLKSVHPQSHGNSDLVAHFFRRAFGLLREGGCFGLVATNTIAQGDTRATGLRWICTHDGDIYRAQKRYKWPGRAAVVVSVVHVHKGRWAGVRVLDCREVDEITAFLFHTGGHEDPAMLTANKGKSFIGNFINGPGFTFDDKVNGASSIQILEELLETEPSCREVVFPYIGGEEVLTDPRATYRRWCINFHDRLEEECRKRWPSLMQILERLVRPKRNSDKRASYMHFWWQHAEKRPELQSRKARLERTLFHPNLAEHSCFVFLPSTWIVAAPHNVFLFEEQQAFTVLQSRIHELWVRFFGSSKEDRLRYTPSDCFETFPFPPDWQASPTLEAAGQAYYEFRAALMVRNDEGLTITYNRFHNPSERHHPDIQRLHELHAAMDRAVLEAYGWSDIPPGCEFLPNYEEGDEDDDGRPKKKHWRYRWPDDVRDEILMRLIALNRERALQEKAGGKTAAPKNPTPAATKASRPKATGKARSRKPPPPGTPLTLFGGDKEPR